MITDDDVMMIVNDDGVIAIDDSNNGYVTLWCYILYILYLFINVIHSERVSRENDISVSTSSPKLKSISCVQKEKRILFFFSIIYTY